MPPSTDLQCTIHMQQAGSIDVHAAPLMYCPTLSHTPSQAPHVVDLRKQVWAGVVPCGPDGVELTGTFQVASTLAYQDSIGQAVLQCCRVIPDGVLLFLPSYSLMERLETRWKVRGEWR